MNNEIWKKNPEKSGIWGKSRLFRYFLSSERVACSTWAWLYATRSEEYFFSIGQPKFIKLRVLILCNVASGQVGLTQICFCPIPPIVFRSPFEVSRFTNDFVSTLKRIWLAARQIPPRLLAFLKRNYIWLCKWKYTLLCVTSGLKK